MQLGYPEHVIVGIGIVELVCLALYVIPPTSVLGAILFTGYLGGAIATHVRIGIPSGRPAAHTHTASTLEFNQGSQSEFFITEVLHHGEVGK